MLSHFFDVVIENVIAIIYVVVIVSIVIVVIVVFPVGIIPLMPLGIYSFFSHFWLRLQKTRVRVADWVGGGMSLNSLSGERNIYIAMERT